MAAFNIALTWIAKNSKTFEDVNKVIALRLVLKNAKKIFDYNVFLRDVHGNLPFRYMFSNELLTEFIMNNQKSSDIDWDDIPHRCISSSSLAKPKSGSYTTSA